jgi:hypothetical protein
MPALETNTRRTVRQKMLRFLRAGVTGTTTSAGDDSEEVNDTNRIEPRDYWKGSEIHVTSNTEEGNTAIVSSNLPQPGELHLEPPFGSAVGSGVTYEIYHRTAWLKQEFDDAIDASLNWARERFLIPHFHEFDMAASTFEYNLPFSEIIAQAATGGSTTTIIDTSGLTQVDDYWNGSIFLVTADTGTAGNVGEVRVITDFVASTDTGTLSHIMPGAVTSGTTYRLIKYPFAYIHRLWRKDSTGEWLPILGDHDGWNVIPGVYPRLFIDGGALEGGSTIKIEGQRFPGVVNVDLDIVEVPFNVLRPYIEYYLREQRAIAGDRGDPQSDRRRARESLEEAEIILEQHVSPINTGSKRAQ